MAMELDLEYGSTGLTLSYHHIYRWFADDAKRTLRIGITSWAGKAERDNPEKTGINDVVEELVITGDTYDAIMLAPVPDKVDNMREASKAAAYLYLMTLPQWKGAYFV